MEDFIYKNKIYKLSTLKLNQYELKIKFPES